MNEKSCVFSICMNRAPSKPHNFAWSKSWIWVKFYCNATWCHPVSFALASHIQYMQVSIRGGLLCITCMLYLYFFPWGCHDQRYSCRIADVPWLCNPVCALYYKPLCCVFASNMIFKDTSVPLSGLSWLCFPVLLIDSTAHLHQPLW